MIPKSLSVFFLAYNDEKTIGKLVYNAYFLLKKLSIDYEIIVGNDASEDGTLKVLKDLKKDIPKLVVIDHKTNQGYGGNLKSGLKKASKEFVFYTDGDGQYDVRELSILLEHLKEDVEVVNGYKRSRGDNAIRRLAGLLYAKWLRFLFGIRIRDVDCDFRLIRNSFLKRIDLVSRSGGICPELVIKLQRLGARFVEVPVSHYRREYGRSQFFTPPRILRTFHEDYKILKMLHYEKFRLVKFLIVGGTSVLIQFLFFNLLLIAIGLHPALATFIGDEFAVFYSFFANNEFTYKDRRIFGKLNIIKKLFNYNLTVLFSTLVQTFVVLAGTRYLGTSYTIALSFYLLGTAFAIVINYSLNAVVIWPKFKMTQQI